MPTHRFSVTVAAGAQVANALAGSQFEFLGAPSVVQVYMAQDTAVGIGEAEVFFGQELEAVQAPIPMRVATLGPEVPEDLIVDDVGAPGDRIVIRLIETGGAAGAVIRGMVKVTPIPRR